MYFNFIFTDGCGQSTAKNKNPNRKDTIPKRRVSDGNNPLSSDFMIRSRPSSFHDAELTTVPEVTISPHEEDNASEGSSRSPSPTSRVGLSFLHLDNTTCVRDWLYDFRGFGFCDKNCCGSVSLRLKPCQQHPRALRNYDSPRSKILGKMFGTLVVLSIKLQSSAHTPPLLYGICMPCTSCTTHRPRCCSTQLRERGQDIFLGNSVSLNLDTKRLQTRQVFLNYFPGILAKTLIL